MFTEKLFKCQFCDKRYSTQKSLNQHMNIHDESKDFKCDVCLKIFPNKAHLNTHYRTHTAKNLLRVKFLNENLLNKVN